MKIRLNRRKGISLEVAAAIRALGTAILVTDRRGIGEAPVRPYPESRTCFMPFLVGLDPFLPLRIDRVRTREVAVAGLIARPNPQKISQMHAPKFVRPYEIHHLLEISLPFRRELAGIGFRRVPVPKLVSSTPGVRDGTTLHPSPALRLSDTIKVGVSVSLKIRVCTGSIINGPKTS